MLHNGYRYIQLFNLNKIQMIKEKDYLKAKQIVQEYEKQLNISDVSDSVFTIKDLKKAFIKGVICGVHDAPKELEDRSVYWYNQMFDKFFKQYYH
jgi:hypothetical protein